MLCSSWGRAPGLCLSPLRSDPSGSGQDPAIAGFGAHPGGSVLDATTLVPGSPGASGGDSFLPTTKEGSSRTAAFPPLPPEPSHASADCISFMQRSTRHFRFSKGVASQLANCRRQSTRVNYQAKWTVHRSWCRRHGHSVSHPSVAKVADFLLHLRCSLSLSYSSIASYRSMLSGVFHFVLPELSSHFVLHDLLRSFQLECPLPSSRVPSWDLLTVLRFLQGSPFEPSSSCSLRDLTRKVLSLVSLAIARRVGELQAVSSSVSFSGDDLYLSYLPEFCAKAESSVRPLPRSFCVRSLKDFVGDLPEVLPLCPVRALHVYLSCTASISPRPRSLFVSPRSPSRSLSKNALSFFLRYLIAQATSSSASSSSSSASSSPQSSTASSRPSSSSSLLTFVRGIAASIAFARNAPLSSILEAATWSSSSVFTSFYLKDVQFSSSDGFSLGLVVAAGSVV